MAEGQQARPAGIPDDAKELDLDEENPPEFVTILSDSLGLVALDKQGWAWFSADRGANWACPQPRFWDVPTAQENPF